jgi:hypothetical protein
MSDRPRCGDAALLTHQAKKSDDLTDASLALFGPLRGINVRIEGVKTLFDDGRHSHRRADVPGSENESFITNALVDFPELIINFLGSLEDEIALVIAVEPFTTDIMHERLRGFWRERTTVRP